MKLRIQKVLGECELNKDNMCNVCGGNPPFSHRDGCTGPRVSYVLQSPLFTGFGSCNIAATMVIEFLLDLERSLWTPLGMACPYCGKTMEYHRASHGKPTYHAPECDLGNVINDVLVGFDMDK